MSARPIDHGGVWGGGRAEFQTFSLCIQLGTEAGCSCIVFIYRFHSRVPQMYLSVSLFADKCVFVRCSLSDDCQKAVKCPTWWGIWLASDNGLTGSTRQITTVWRDWWCKENLVCDFRKIYNMPCNMQCRCTLSTTQPVC